MNTTFLSLKKPKRGKLGPSFGMPDSILCGWITVATVAKYFSLLFLATWNWSGWGISESSLWALIMNFGVSEPW